MALTKITSAIIADGAITASAITNTSITADKLHTTLDLTGKAVTVATATAGDNDTTAASTAFVSTAIANLADSAPSTLNTLNELAAALGDDANFSTTVTNSIALKAPLASPTFTGTVEIPNLTISSAQGSDGQVLTSTGSGIAWEDAAGGVDGIVSSADATAITIDSSENTTFSGNVTVDGFTSEKYLTLRSGFAPEASGGVGLRAANHAASNRDGLAIYGHDGVSILTAQTERIRIASAGQIGIGGANYGTDGQILTSTGSSSAPAWEDAPAGGPTFKTFGTSSFMVGDDATGTINAADYNTGLGVDVFAALTEGDKNVAVGYGAAKDLTTGVQNTAVGEQALTGVTTTNNNTAIGYRAMTVAGATECTAIGTQALNACSGDANTAVGWQSLVNNGSGSNNTAVGYWALKSTTTSSYNVAVGAYAGYAITTASGYGTYLGYNAGKSHTGGRSVFVGEHAGFDATTTDDSVFVGRLAGENVTTGYTNVIMGDRAGKLVTTGFNNTLLGYKAGDNLTTGAGSVIIGTCDANGASVNNEIIIGSGLGGKGYHQAFIGGINGIYNQPNSSSWSTTSDRRIKKNIHDYTLGLDVLKQIQVRNFEYRELEEMELGTDGQPLEKSELPKGNQVGVIAQEIQDILPGMVRENETNGRLSVDSDEVTWLLVKAVQELSAKVEELQNG